MGRRIHRGHFVVLRCIFERKREVVLLIIPRENGLLALHLFSKIKRSKKEALDEIVTRIMDMREVI